MSPPVWRDAVTKKGLSSRVKMFDKNLVHAIIGGKDLDCRSAELSVDLVLTRGHGSLLLDPSYFRAVGHPEVIHFIRHAEPQPDIRDRGASKPLWRDCLRHQG